MLKKALLAALLIILVGALLFGGCSTKSSGPVKIKLGYDTPPVTGLGVPAEYFAKQVNDRLGGRVTVETYPSGTLATQGSSLESLRAGVADAYIISIGSNLDSFPIMNFTSLPGLNFYPDTNDLLKTEVDTMRAIMDKFPEAADEMKDFKLLYSNSYSSAVLMVKGNPIRVPADMVGVKVGADGLRQDTVDRIGGVPVFTIPPQMYQQIQTGVISATLVAWGAALDWQLQEQVNSVLDLSFGGSQLPVVMNKSVWDKISSSDQKLIMDIAMEAEQVNRDFVDKQIPEARQKWVDAGVNVIKPTAAEKAEWTAKFQIVWDEYINKNKKAGVKDIDAIFNYWKDAVEKAQQ
jgi:TRAP-type C4-dicarboxylate transport system substrate-binding protein